MHSGGGWRRRLQNYTPTCEHTRIPHHNLISRDVSERLLVVAGTLWIHPFIATSRNRMKR